VIETQRLILRAVDDGDRDGFAAMCADADVMRYFQSPLTRQESDAYIDAIIAHRAANGFAVNAVEIKGGPRFIGIVGLWRVRISLPFGPGVEIAWRLAKEFHLKGYASEAARACLEDGFKQHGLDEILSFTARINTPSQAVMRSIGMTYDPRDDFDHPSVKAGHILRPHVLYRKRAKAA
jgi:RimJ/RimL family protein N-acetyltransferase